jgi:hypothetical protein
MRRHFGLRATASGGDKKMKAMFGGVSRAHRSMVIGRPLGLVWVLALLLTLPASPASAQASATGSSPQLAWARQFGTAEDDSSYGITADSTGSYVIGTLDGKDLVRKYDVRGDKLWTRHFERVRAITSDSTGVYVGGNGSVRKYDASGNTEWTREDLGAQIRWMTVDSTGVYAASGHYVTKYDRSGNRLWQRSLPGEMFAAHSTGLYVARTHHIEDSRGNVIPIAMEIGKYDANGETVWVRHFRPVPDRCSVPDAIPCLGEWRIWGRNWATAIAADATGVYAVANGRYLGKYDNGGDLLYTATAEPWTGLEARAIATNSTGVYVVGSDDGDAFVRRYDTRGNETWSEKLGSSQNDSLHAVTATSDGVYVAGDTTGALPGQTSAGKRDVIAARYGTTDAGCDSLWTRQFAGSSVDTATAVATDAAGVYAAGSTDGRFSGQMSAGGDDAYVSKHDGDGNLLWWAQFGSAGEERANGVATGSTGVYVAGQAGDQAFVRKYDASGALLWERRYRSSGTGVEGAYGVTLGSDGVYVAGGVSGALPGKPHAGYSDAYVRKYDARGNELWTRQFGTSGNDQANAITAHSSGVYAVGNMGSKAFVSKIDSHGRLLWERQFGATASDSATATVNAAAADSSGVSLIADDSGARVLAWFDTDGNGPTVGYRNVADAAIAVDSSGMYVAGGKNANAYVHKLPLAGGAPQGPI